MVVAVATVWHLGVTPPSSDRYLLPLQFVVGLKYLTLGSPDSCVRCRMELPSGAAARWDRELKAIFCLGCERRLRDPFAIDDLTHSQAGASAALEYERRSGRSGRDLGHVTAWLKGAAGERELGKLLDTFDGVWVLHDRRIPGSKANIDHLVVASTGVWVVDAKKYKGRIEIRHRGPLGIGGGRLYVGGRSRDGLIEGVRRQVREVRSIVNGISVVGALCFVHGEWGPARMAGWVGKVAVHHPSSLRRALERRGLLGHLQRSEIAQKLDAVFKPAVRAPTRE